MFFVVIAVVAIAFVVYLFATRLRPEKDQAPPDMAHTKQLNKTVDQH